MAGSYFHILIFAMMDAEDDDYASVRSTPSQYWLELWKCKASSLGDAIWNQKTWVYDGYVTWIQVMIWLYYGDTFEAQLFTNNLQGEAGVTISYRYLSRFRSWTTAIVDIPTMDQELKHVSQLGCYQSVFSFFTLGCLFLF